MTLAFLIFYILVALALIGLVLLQDPKGGSAGVFGGGGGGQSLFGATGATSFIVKATRLVAVLFGLCILGLNYSLMSGGTTSATEKVDVIEAPDFGTKTEEKSEGTSIEVKPEVDPKAESDQN